MPRMPNQSTGIEMADSPSPVSQGSQDKATAVLGSLQITLSLLSDLSLPGNGGEALHGFLLTLIAHRDPALASRLHDIKGAKPFSLSPVQGCQNWEGRSFLARDKLFSFQLGLLETELLAAATAAFFEAELNHQELTLGRTPVEIKEVEAKQYRNSSFISFQDLLTQASKEREITLQFLSPTTFKVKGSSLPFPLPELVFSSLLQRWESFSPVALPLSLRECFPSLRVSRYELKTELISFSKFKAIGFTGVVVYELPDDLTLPVVQALNCLADFAFYSGVGWKTTMGMGYTRRIDYARSLPDGTRGDPEKRG